MTCQLSVAVVDLHRPGRMKSVVQLDINAPQAKVDRLFEDPHLLPRWMDDLERVEPVDDSGIHGGARFRMVPRDGTLVFVGRVVDREPPVRTQMALDGPTVSVTVTGTSARLSDAKTRFESEGIFAFKGLLGHVFGWLGRWSIRRAHRRHIEAFKRFAESQ